jgi:hypothetical protein
MSEFQYYEFLAVDKPLSAEQQRELRAMSTRARITATSFTNTYQWGDLKANPVHLMERHFDVHVYASNWGHYRLLLRLPKAAVDMELIALYCGTEALDFTETEDHVILDFNASEVETDAWWEPGDCSAGLASLRGDLLRGDYRCLYLAWLTGIQWAGEEDEEEDAPPVPAGLKDLSPALRSFMEFFDVDADLVAAAAARSPQLASEPDMTKDIASWIVSMPDKRKNELLVRWLCNDELGLRLGLLAEMRKTLTGKRPAPARSEHRSDSVTDLLQAARQIRTEREEREAERRAEEQKRREREEAATRRNYLDDLAGHQLDAWKRVALMIESKQPKRYDEAVLLILDLQEIAEHSGTRTDFEKRIEAIRTRHQLKRTLIDRMDKAGLVRTR